MKHDIDVVQEDCGLCRKVLHCGCLKLDHIKGDELASNVRDLAMELSIVAIGLSAIA